MSSSTAETGSAGHSHAHGDAHGADLAKLALGALGVVYGDIGTSPLYSIKECFTAPHGVTPTTENVLGILSLFFWALTLTIVVKYLSFIMRADNKGEGGILALLALVAPRGGGPNPPLVKTVLIMLGLFGAALLYGDGVITPAISVLSAVEGLEVATHTFKPFVVPITIAILVLLFWVQKRGTAGIGAVFGPTMLVWFAAIGLMGAPWILRQPHILAAVWPGHAVSFFVHHGVHGFLVLGSVVLCITGGEALYADMGHFGRSPIRWAWYIIVFPALLLNYFGQGAMLLTQCTAMDANSCTVALGNPFFQLVGGWLVYPTVALSTVATVVASQALISGAFSLTQQAVQLGYCPRVQIVHTSGEAEGQIYVPEVNTALMVACVALVLGFRESSNLAAAYGIAVTGTMSITSVLFYAVAREKWNWSRLKAGSLVLLFLAIDMAFFGANVIKIASGGWFPIAVALFVFSLMTTWKKGRQYLQMYLMAATQPLDLFMSSLKEMKPVRVRGTAVFMTANPDVPPALLHHWKHNKVLHEQVVLLSVRTEGVPEVPFDERVEVAELGEGFWRVSARYGFMQNPNVPEILRACTARGLQTVEGDTSFYLGRETLLTTGRANMARWRKALFVFMSRNARPATSFFSIPPNRVVELGTQIEM